MTLEELREKILLLQAWRRERYRMWKEVDAKEKAFEETIPGWSLWWDDAHDIYILSPKGEL